MLDYQKLSRLMLDYLNTYLCQFITYFLYVNEIDAFFFHFFNYLKIVIYIKETYMIIFYKNDIGNNLFWTTYSQKIKISYLEYGIFSCLSSLV